MYVLHIYILYYFIILNIKNYTYINEYYLPTQYDVCMISKCMVLYSDHSVGFNDKRANVITYRCIALTHTQQTIYAYTHIHSHTRIYKRTCICIHGITHAYRRMRIIVYMHTHMRTLICIAHTNTLIDLNTSACIVHLHTDHQQ